MKIACLGWGSLIWNPGGLPVRGPWFSDGPLLPLEFARESGEKEKKNRRITIALTPDMLPVRSFWTLLSVSDLSEAKVALASREQTAIKNIGAWMRGEESGGQQLCIESTVESWASAIGLDAVVWTSLGPGFRGKRNTVPNIEAVIEFLKRLRGNEARMAEEYIRLTPVQIDTAYRRRIALEFSWAPTTCR